MRWLPALVLMLTLPGAEAAPAAQEGLPPFTTEPLEVERTPEPFPRIVDIRTGRHEDFDRVVLDLDGPLPGYTLRFVPVLEQEGSGEQVDVRGEESLELLVTPARAHDRQGRSTVPERRETVAGEALREARLISDFEARVLVGIGASERTGFRAFTLSDPNRLVVDVAHPETGPGDPGTTTTSAATTTTTASTTTTSTTSTPAGGDTDGGAGAPADDGTDGGWFDWVTAAVVLGAVAVTALLAVGVRMVTRNRGGPSTFQ